MKKLFTIIIVLLLTAIGFAQEEGIRSFSLKEAVDFALDNNKSVKNAKLDEQKAKAFNWEILTQGLPQVNAGIEYDYNFKVAQIPALTKQFTDPNSTINRVLHELAVANPNVGAILQGGGGGFSNVSFVLPHTLNSNLSLSQLLFDARYVFGIKARKDLAKTSRLSTTLTEQEIRYTIIKAYYQAEAAQEAKSLLTENKKIIEKLLTDTRATFGQGLIEELDVNRLELAQATLESQINYQNRMSDVALSNLKFQMGLPLGEAIILKDKLDELKAGVNLSAERNFDEKNRPEYDLLNTAITLKGYDIAQKRSGYYPSLAGFLNYGWAAQAQKFGDIFKSYTNADGSKGTNWYSQGLVGIKLNIPIFDSGLKMAQVKQAKIEQMKSANDFENFKSAAQLQFQVAQSGLNSAISDEAIAQKTLDLSQKIFSKNQIKFTEGVGSSFELAQSQQEYTTNLIKHIQSEMNLLNSKADLDKAMGVK